MTMSRLLVLILLVAGTYIVIKALQRFFSSVKTRVGHEPKPAEGGEMIQDPVCGVYIPKMKAIEGRVRGETHFFCSPQCLERYRVSAGKGENR
jgi:YHS domain-containing protein